MILIEDDKIALIERYRAGMHYFVFPGGKIERGESPQVAAKRESLEELGLQVKIGARVAEVWYLGTPQYYYLAARTGGKFGTGNGKEMHSAPSSESGSHRPVWVALDELPEINLLPKLLVDYVRSSHASGWPTSPLVVVDRPPDDVS